MKWTTQVDPCCCLFITNNSSFVYFQGPLTVEQDACSLVLVISHVHRQQ